MEKTFLIAQFLGFFALTSSIISVTQKTRSKYIIFNILQNCFSSIQYFFLYKYIAFYLCLISIVRLILYNFRQYFNKTINIIILFAFIIINILISLLNFKFWYDIIPLLASTLVCYTVWQKNIIVIRWGCLISKVLWGVYATISLAYFSIIMDIFMIIWTSVLLIKYKKPQKLK